MSLKRKYQIDLENPRNRLFLGLGLFFTLWTLVYFFPVRAFPFEICTLKRIFGIPCPSCGLTRSIVYLSHFQFQKAFDLNPLGTFTAVVCLLGYFFWLIQPFIFKTFFWKEKGKKVIECKPLWRILVIGFFVVLAGNWFSILIRQFYFGISY